MGNLRGRRVRELERDHGIIEAEPIWAVLLAAGTCSRRQALEWFYAVEVREATQQGRAPDAGRPIMALHLIDTAYPRRVVQQNLQVSSSSSMAFDFSGWTREEISILIAAIDPLAAQPTRDQEAVAVAAAEKVGPLMDHYEAVQADDERLMAIVAGKPDLGGGT